MYQRFEPPEALKNTINCFWYTCIDFSELPSGFEILPDGFAEIIFYFGSPCSISSYKEGLQPLPSPFLTGLLGQPVFLHAKNQLEIMGIKCYPWMVFGLLGLPSGNDGVRIFEHPIASLQSTLAKYIQADKIAEAVAELIQYFLNAQPQVATSNLLSKAGVAMGKANGTMPVKQVAAAAHATVRTLERNFKLAAGYTVKDVSGLMRFEQARNHLWLDPNVNLSGLAYELGYTDQAHLNREFKRYSGTTPAAFARKTKKEKQPVINNFVAFIQA